MLSEWNKWLNGLTLFKERQGLLWVFVLLILSALWQKTDRKQRKLLVFSLLMGVCILFPLTAVVLLKGYTPFYDWLDLQLLLPLVLLLAWGGTQLVSSMQNMEIPGLHLKKIAQTIISFLSVSVLLLAGTVFHGLDRQPEANRNGVPVQVAEILEPLYKMFENETLVLAAPSEILMYTRLYEVNWEPLYGRDLWSSKAASYINSGYNIEYKYYELLEKEQLDEDEFIQLTELIIEGPADCVIVPTQWLAGMGQFTDRGLVNLTDSYTGIIKKDLMTE